MASNSLGYDDGMFVGDVRDSLRCVICMNVLRDPRMCQEKEHVFCRECVERHLAINQTCPVCREPLTVATLRPPTRFFMECWSDLQIKCQYYDRGCSAPVRLGLLDGHVTACDFAAVPCTNNGCNMAVNRKDLQQHEVEQCQFRRGKKCAGCLEVKNEVKELKDVVEEMKDETRRNQEQSVAFQEMVLEHLQMIKDEMKASAEAMQGNLVKLVEASVDKVMANQTDLQQQFQKISITGSFPQACAQQSEKRTLQNNDIFIFGGGTDKEGCSSSGEKFCWGTGQWSELPEMRDGRVEASCFVRGPEVFVAGGECRDDFTDNIETLNSDEEPLQWRQFGGKLPDTLYGHQTVVSCNKAIVTGGEGRNDMYSNNISELQLDRPYSGKVLCKMAVERAYHGCVVVGDKVFCLGGRKGWSSGDVLKSVCMFNVQTNKCTELPPLPYAVCSMSTVVCEGRIFVIGGEDGDGNTLNKVFSYDVETGENEMLPPMKYKRSCCSAVVARDGFVVMGGRNEEDKWLNSVEYFKLSTGSWQELAPMIQPRSYACAVVKP